MAAAKNNGRSKKAVDETPKDWERDNGKDLNIGLERSLSQRPFKKIRTSHVSLVSSVPPPSITLLHSSSTMPSSGLKEDRTLARPQLPPINTTKVYRGVKRPHSGKLEVEICIPRNMTRLWLNEAALAYNYAACKLRGMYALLNFSFLYKDIAVSTAPRISLSSLPMLHENLFPHWSSKQSQQTLKCLNLQASNMELMPPPPLGDNTSENSGLGLHDADANDEFQGIATGPGTGDGVVESKESEWEAWCNSILVGLDAGSPIRDYTWPWPPLLPCGDNPDDDLGLGLREATASEEVQAIATIAGRGAGEGADESVWGDLLNANLSGWGTGSPVWGYMCNSILAGLDAGSPIRDYTWPWPPLLPCGDNPDDDLGLGLREATASEEVQAIATLAGRGAGEAANESVWVDWLNADLAGWGTGSPFGVICLLLLL
ncbi:hypothetical protein L1049_025191 [Liquidambar formosana]|uniref:AP2/ERF domain-containing protein n=1 Tax=Liquidambar formosana TaxID=63359 RepID=A0AAP0RWZ1_LIQFO